MWERVRSGPLAQTRRGRGECWASRTTKLDAEEGDIWRLKQFELKLRVKGAGALQATSLFRRITEVLGLGALGTPAAAASDRHRSRARRLSGRIGRPQPETFALLAEKQLMCAEGPPEPSWRRMSCWPLHGSSGGDANCLLSLKTTCCRTGRHASALI